MRFIVSLVIRSPWRLQKHIDSSPRVLLETFVNDPYEEEDPAETFRKVTDAHPHLTRDLAVRAMTHVVHNSSTHPVLLDSEWIIRKIAGPVDLVLSDNPVIRVGDFQSDYLLALPMSPRRLFVLHKERSQFAATVKGLADKELALRINRDGASQAEEYVYSTGPHHEGLARKYLRRP